MTKFPTSKQTFSFIFLSTFLLLQACKKDTDRKLTGNYVGTVIYRYYEPRNSTPTVDKVYNNITIAVSEGSQSTRKVTRLAFTYSNASISTSYNENINVDNGVIKDTYTNKGAVGTYYRWIGFIHSDSMKVSHRVEQYNGSLHEYLIEAERN